MREFARYLILRNISFLRGQEFTLTELAKEIGSNCRSPYFVLIMRELFELGYVGVVKRVGNAKIVKILKYKRIWALAKETQAYGEFVLGVSKNEHMYHLP